MRRIGILTSGGDSPGMNTAVVAVARAASAMHMPLVGVKRGYNGLLRKSANIKDDLLELDLDTVLDICDLPGTYLRTARCKEFLDPVMRKKALNTLREMNIDGLVVVGGDGSFNGALRLCELGFPCIGIPGTIDNDLAYTEMTLGYDTAVNVCVEAVRSIRATSRSHDRPAVVEVMGRHCGDIALTTAVSTGAEMVLVPEVPWSIDEVAARLSALVAKGNTRSTIVVAEGCWESMKPFDVYEFLAPLGVNVYPGERMNADNLARVLHAICAVEARPTVLGYTQRGASPCARDSAFAFEAGYMAVQLLCNGISNMVIGVRNGQTFYMPIADALREKRAFNRDLYEVVNTL